MGKNKNKNFKLENSNELDLNEKGNGNKRKPFNKSRKFGLSKKGVRFNDISYYMKNKSITDAFAKLPFSWIVGNTMTNTNQQIAFPAIVSYLIDWMASTDSAAHLIGEESYLESKSGDILNQVATIIYTQMRRANSGSTNNIEHTDVLISNLLASIDLLVNAHYVNRIFKIANTFSWRNRLIPQSIFEDHLSIDYEDFIDNQANYRGRYNTLIAQAKTIRTLADFPFINAIMDEFNNIFKDSDTDTGRESYIISVKPFHHIFDPVGLSDFPGGMIRLVKVGDLNLTDYDPDVNKIVVTGVKSEGVKAIKFSVLLDIMQAQINALITDNDFNTIQADIEKAFGEQSGYIVIDPVTSDSTITPIYSGEFNMMFENGKFMPWEPNALDITTVENDSGGFVRAANPDNIRHHIVQKNDGTRTNLYTFVWFKTLINPANLPRNLNLNIVNMDTLDPSVEDIVIATRFKRFTKVVDSQTLQSLPDSMKPVPGIRVMVPYACSNFMCWGGNVTVIKTGADNVSKQLSTWDNLTDAIPNILLALEHHPLFINSNGMVYSNVNNMRGVTESELRPIQDSCFLSLWNLPSKTNI